MKTHLKDAMKNASEIALRLQESLAQKKRVTEHFVELQSLLHDQIFELLLEEALEDTYSLSTIDRLNLLEKREFLPSVEMWEIIRNINSSDDATIKEYTPWLLEYWQWFEAQVRDRITERVY